MITITLNGESFSTEQPCTIRRLLEDCKMATAICAVEVNREVIPRRSHEAHELHEGDVVEVVSLVGGG